MAARQAKILQPSHEGSDFTLGLSGGAAHRLVAEAASGAASNIIIAPLTPVPLIGDVALFIDQNLQQLDGALPARLTLQSALWEKEHTVAELTFLSSLMLLRDFLT